MNPQTSTEVTLCSVAGCWRGVHARGWCGMHYTRWRRAGGPLGIRRRPVTDPAVRFWRYVQPQADGCWDWVGRTDTHGYGSFSLTHSKPVGAHRFAYELMVGPVPEGLELDHLCRRRNCCNPNHLEPVTPRVNQRRGFGVAGVNARKTQCPRGHEYTEENTYWHRGRRHCRECKRDSVRRDRANKRAAA